MLRLSSSFSFMMHSLSSFLFRVSRMWQLWIGRRLGIGGVMLISQQSLLHFMINVLISFFILVEVQLVPQYLLKYSVSSSRNYKSRQWTTQSSLREPMIMLIDFDWKKLNASLYLRYCSCFMFRIIELNISQINITSMSDNQASPTPLKALRQQLENSQNLAKKIKKISEKLHYEGIERINSTALFEVKAKHTHEFTIQIGAGYFAQVNAEHAIQIIERRIKRMEEDVKKHEAIEQRAKAKKEKRADKASSVKFNQSHMKSYLQVVGEENGEQIINIVEREGEDEITQLTTTNEHQEQSGNNHENHTQDKERIDFPRNQLYGEPIKQQDQEDDFEKSEKSQKSDVSEESENQYGDLIHYHRKKVMGIDSEQVVSTPQIPASTPNVSTPKSQSAVSMQQISKTDSVKSESAKKRKRVSFADEQSGGKLAQLLREQQQKEGTINELKGKEKEREKEKPKSSKKEDDIEKIQSGKVSRFKLERIKARMESK